MKKLANKIHDAFDSLRADPQLVASTKQFLSEERKKKQKTNRSPVFQKALAVVCLAFVLVAGIGGYTWIQAPVSYVGIDVNPSIELALNRFDKVVSVHAYNEEGEEILKSLQLKGKTYTEAIDTIVGSKEMKAYLKKRAELVFTVAADSRRESGLKSGVESCLDHMGYKSQSVSVDIGIVPQAHSLGLSLGKYYAWQQLIQYDDTVTADECKDMSISELHERIDEHEHGGDHGQGSGHGDEADNEQGHTDETNDKQGTGQGAGHEKEPDHNQETGQNQEGDTQGMGNGEGAHGQKGNHGQQGKHGKGH